MWKVPRYWLLSGFEEARCFLLDSLHYKLYGLKKDDRSALPTEVTDTE